MHALLQRGNFTQLFGASAFLISESTPQHFIASAGMMPDKDYLAAIGSLDFCL
jgi:hypothetical protein